MPDENKSFRAWVSFDPLRNLGFGQSPWRVVACDVILANNAKRQAFLASREKHERIGFEYEIKMIEDYAKLHSINLTLLATSLRGIALNAPRRN